jgi:FtsP/CotA-like multicopper oxidase with cupredoxin domain
VSSTIAAPVPGGTLDPLTIPKYVDPLVIPPTMPLSPNTSPYNQGANVQYNIAVRQFPQQILPTTDINGAPLNPTPVWSYGRAEDPVPAVGPAPATQTTFNYPAFTIENTADSGTTVRWINELVATDALGYPCNSPLSAAGCPATFLPHVVAGSVDRSLHWANPELLQCMDGTSRTDCRPSPDSTINPNLAVPYDGPVPIVTHVHGAHVNPNSDGYPEAWWLPNAVDAAGNPISATYATTGAQFKQVGNNGYPGSARFTYRNDQPAATIWYHDHTLGMTRSNVYAGPAGFWMVRGTYTDPVTGTPVPDSATDGTTGTAAVLPGEAGTIPGLPGRPTNPTTGGCDPNFDATCRASIREIPIAIQDRSFNADSTLFYPQSRDFFNFTKPGIVIPYVPYDPATCAATLTCSDIAPIWNPEFFGNTIVVNGKTWPDLQATPQRYRLRLLNGSDSRFMNLSLWIVPPKCTNAAGCAPAANAYTLNSKQLINKAKYAEMPIYQIGGDQGFLPQVVEITTGFATPLPGDGTSVAFGTAVAQPATFPDQALLMGPAERTDIILDFTSLVPGTVVRMVNTGPDAPFGGFPAAPVADKETSGQVMSFTVVAAGLGITDPSTPVENLVLSAEGPLGAANNVRPLSLNEAESEQICVRANAVNGKITKVVLTLPFPDPQLPTICAAVNAVPFAPKEALLGTADLGVPAPKLWSDPITQNVDAVGTTEEWDLYNVTVDAHPIHIHLVRFQVIDRQPLVIDPLTGMPQIPLTRDPALPARPAEPTEAGYKDTVIAYPGEVAKVRALFDIRGLYVWHCHILSHEDNEMMLPFCVGGTPGQNCPNSTVPIAL